MTFRVETPGAAGRNSSAARKARSTARGGPRRLTSVEGVARTSTPVAADDRRSAPAFDETRTSRRPASASLTEMPAPTRDQGAAPSASAATAVAAPSIVKMGGSFRGRTFRRSVFEVQAASPDDRTFKEKDGGSSRRLRQNRLMASDRASSKVSAPQPP